MLHFLHFQIASVYSFDMNALKAEFSLMHCVFDEHPCNGVEERQARGNRDLHQLRS